MDVKPCIACGKTIVRKPGDSDLSWSIKQYCCAACFNRKADKKC